MSFNDRDRFASKRSLISPENPRMGESSPQRPSIGAKTLLGDLLRQVSRSFFLTLRVLPSKIRPQVGLAYLFCRAADTIADTDLISAQQRLSVLLFYRNQFLPSGPDREGLVGISRGFSGRALPGEHALLERLPECFDLLRSFDEADRQAIGELVRTLTQGMEMDLLSFPQGRPGAPQALAGLEDLDRYTYFVAGCVGEFWTRICRGHVKGLRGWDLNRMESLGVRFGKGLQLTNVLKDISLDLARGRCYLPGTLLERHGLKAEMLLDPGSRGTILPLVKELAALALGHLEAGWGYCAAIPRSQVRLRSACVWPLFFALATLREILHSPSLLDPKRPVKIRRSAVYRIMVLSSVQIFSNTALDFYFRILRRRLLRSLREAR